MPLLLYLSIIKLIAFYNTSEVNQKVEIQNFLINGKYGLFIKIVDNQYEVNWLTKEQEQGFIATYQNEKLIIKDATPESIIHVKTIPKMNDPFTIEFGGQFSGTSKVIIQPIIERASSSFNNIDSIYVMGDTHGNFDEVVQILKNANLINENLQWKGGTSHFVFMGDILDRGKDAIRLAWFIYELEQDAQIKGGKVHLILGNHEIMVMSNDLRYVSAKEKQIAATYQLNYNQLFDPTKTLIGQWITSKPAVLKIDKLLFTHGGIIVNTPIKEINDSVYAYSHESIFTHLMDDTIDSTFYSQNQWLARRDYFYNSYSPFWFRGYVQSDTLGRYLDFILKKNSSNIHIVGHTIVPTILERYDGKLIATNVEKGGTEMLLMVKRKKKKYDRFKISLDGSITDYNHP